MADTLASLAADFAKAAAAITPAAAAITRNSSAAIKADWRNTWPWSGTTHLPLMTHKGPGLGRRVNYSVTTKALGVEGEIGVDNEGAGQLGHIIEFGSINNAPHPGGAPALAKNAPAYVAQLALVAQALALGKVGAFGTDRGRFNVKDRDTGEAWPGFEGSSGVTSFRPT